MKILLVNTNTYRFMSPMPLGLAFVAAGLQEQEHEVRLTDLMFASDPHAQLREAIASFQPDVAGFTIRNLDNQDMGDPITLLPQIKEFVQQAKGAGVPTVLGGTAFTTFPAAMLEYMAADYGIAGQGEVSMPRLVQGIDHGEVDREIPGLVWREEDGIRTNPPVMTGYRHVRGDWSVLSIQGYRHSMMPAAVLVRTGCPHECSYCDAAATFGKRFHHRDPEEIVEDIRALRQQFRVASFFLVDPCLNSPLPQAKEVLEAIVRADLGVLFTAILAPMSGDYDDEFLALYKRAGGHFAVLGVESFSDTMLRSYQKPFEMHDVLEFSKMLRRHGIMFIVDLMFGGPGETLETLQESFDAMAHVPYSAAVAARGLRILPGTAVYQTAVEEGVVAGKEELFTPRFYFSPQLDREMVVPMIDKAVKKHAYRGIGMLPYGVRNVLARYLNVAV